MPSTSFHARLTLTVVARMQPGDVVWDTELPGFGARRQRHRISYHLKTRIGGKQKWFTIGKHGEPWNPKTARKQALTLKANPGVAATAQQSVVRVSEVVEAFKADHLAKLKASTERDYRYVLDKRVMPEFGDTPICDVTRVDISAFHNDLKAKPRAANLTLAVVSKLMSWAEENGYRPLKSNPCVGIKKFPEKKRERYLTTDELGNFGRALTNAEQKGDISIYAAAALRLLILTGARLGEVLSLRWDFVDLSRKQCRLPDSKTGQKTIQLSKAAIDVLKTLPRLKGNPYVIVGRRDGQPIVNLQKPWRLVRDAAKLTDVRLHDLRHSYASVAAASGGSLPMIGKLLGHTQAQTTARYAHLADAPTQKLNESVGRSIGQALKSTDRKRGKRL